VSAGAEDRPGDLTGWRRRGPTANHLHRSLKDQLLLGRAQPGTTERTQWRRLPDQAADGLQWLRLRGRLQFVRTMTVRRRAKGIKL